MVEENYKNNRTGIEIAVIGMAGRFPGAKNINEFWENLINGVESISFFSEEESNQLEIEPRILNHPDFVRSKGGVLEDTELFDDTFFDYSPTEAALMDPQVRMFHECAWEALEHAGYHPESYNGLIGLYAGASNNLEWEVLSENSWQDDETGQYAAVLLNNKDFLCTRISYKLNLKGPVVLVQTGCSTSLVTIHMACQALLNAECDMALAGGVSILSFYEGGYIYREGMIFSRDGHCRAFDAKAKGTTGGNGAGVVVLKLLDDAINDGDTIHALVKGTAINNDGIRKSGYTAPSREGQTEVIRVACQVAEVEPASITYVECHGTGTKVGDPIEIEALTQAFNTDKKGFCAIGSVKTNIGHLDEAAGAASFIKTVLALKHQLIPPSLHFESPNPEIDFENSAFVVNTRVKEWKNQEYPLRAGVSSFGIGGTNAHAILEEWPAAQCVERTAQVEGREYQLILLSAKTQTAREQMTQNLAEYFKINPGINLADAAYTLQVGRQAFKHRKMMVCSTHDRDEAVAHLSAPTSESVFISSSTTEDGSVIFMFPGQGSQYVNMGLDLYKTEPVFRQEMDGCFEILKPLMGYDIKEILYPEHHPALTGHPSQEGSVGARSGSPCPPQDCVGSPGQGHHRDPTTEPLQSARPSGPVDSPLERGTPDPRKGGGVSDRINQTEIAQPVLFVFEYALAKLLMSWGIIPDALVGHSIGEYVAACLAGVFSLEDALRLVTLRGKLMQQMPPGAMLVVQLSEEQLIPLLTSHDQLALAAVNGPSLCVVAGPTEEVNAFTEELEEKGIKTRRLHTSHAFHSPMMAPIIKEFEKGVETLRLNKPQLPYISNVSGTWITAEDATSSRYWANHLRKTVRFWDGVKELLKENNPIFLEVGPGNALGTLLRKITRKEPQTLPGIISLVRHPREDGPDTRYLLAQVGRVWLYGKGIDWKGFHAGETRQRIPLPTYPFEGKIFRTTGDSFNDKKKSFLAKNPTKAEWFYIPVWEQSVPPVYNYNGREGTQRFKWLIFIDDHNDNAVGARLAKRLQAQAQEVVTVETGERFANIGNNQFVINLQRHDEYGLLFDNLKELEMVPDRIIHLWNLSENIAIESGFEEIERSLDAGFYSLLYTVQAIGSRGITSDIKIQVVTHSLHHVTGEEKTNPLQAPVLGAVKVIPLEYPNISCRCVDIVLPVPNSRWQSGSHRLVDHLLGEFNLEIPDIVAAYRGKHRWVQKIKPHRLEKFNGSNSNQRLREKGVYLVTGGLGGMGFTLAEHLAQRLKAKLILVGRSEFPPRKEWQRLLETAAHQQDQDKNDNMKAQIRQIRKIVELEGMGAEMMVANADVSDKEQMRDVVARAEERFGPINGILHTAGIADYEGIIQGRTRQMTEKVMAPKVKGTIVLDGIFKDKQLDFFVLFSSAGNILYQNNFGEVGYNAANEFLDAFARYKNTDTPTHTPTMQTQQGNGTYTTAINWTMWQEVGMSIKALKKRSERGRENILHESFLKTALSPSEGVEVFNRILENESSLVQVVISPQDLVSMVEHMPITAKRGEKSLVPELMSVEANPGNGGDFHQRPDISTRYIKPENELEQILAEIFQNFLGIQQVGIDDSFFELGLSSLDLVQISTKLKEKLNQDIHVVTMFTYSTVRALAQYMKQEEERAAEASAAEENENEPVNLLQDSIDLLNVNAKGDRYDHQIER